MPGRKRYDAVNDVVSKVQLPKFVSKDDKFYLDPEFDGSAWETLKSQANDLQAKAKDLNEHPHLHESHKDKAGDVTTAAEAFQGMVMTAYNEWRAVPDGGECKQTESMIGLGNVLQQMRSTLGSFDQDKLDASTAMFGN